MRARFVLEKFIQDSDPITDMGIGMEYQIEQWIKRQDVYSPPHIKNTSRVLEVLIGYDAPPKYIEFILDTRTNYDKNAVLNRCFFMNDMIL